MTELLAAMTVPVVAYLVISGLLTLDAFVPVVPAQALMIGGGMLAAHGHLHLAIVIAAGAAGVFTGDMACYLLGRRAWSGRRAPGFARRAGERLTGALRSKGFLIVLVCRFLPGGRMVTAAHAGRTGYPGRRFLAYDLLAAMLWASYGAVVGNVGGEAISDSSWLPLVVAVAGATLFASAGWLYAFVGQPRTRQPGSPRARRWGLRSLGGRARVDGDSHHPDKPGGAEHDGGADPAEPALASAQPSRFR